MPAAVMTERLSTRWFPSMAIEAPLCGRAQAIALWRKYYR
jgi:hypothetical protein